MAKRVAAPIIPRNHADPTSLDPLERRAMADFRRRFRLIEAKAIELLNSVEYTTITVNAVRYVYDIRPDMIAMMMTQMSDFIDDVLMEDSQDAMQATWFFQAYVNPAYQLGTAQAFANLSKQSPAYKSGAMSTREIMLKPPYQRRVALLGAREFELMKGITGDTKSALARTLTDGFARGKGPRDIAKSIREQTGMSIARSERIARTELTTALKRARLDEADDAAETYGVVSKQMHMSALSPTTRRTHAARSGNLYTTDEIREWYSHSGNSINCKCTQIEVLVDDDGKPLLPKIGQRLKAARDDYEREHGIDLSTVDDED